MGIEIDIYAERRVDGGWVLAEPMVPNPWLLPENRELLDDPDDPILGWVEVPCKVVEFGHRSLSELLAGPSSTWYRHVPIVEPRGVPDDLSDDLAAYTAVELAHPYQNGTGWYLLEELLTHDWDRIERYRRYTSIQPFFTPNKWRWPTPWPWRQWETVTHADIAASLFLDALKKLQTIDDPARVRIVFWVH